MRDAVITAGQLGQYTLEEKIGEGGMGAVYRGRTPCCGAQAVELLRRQKPPRCPSRASSARCNSPAN